MKILAVCQYYYPEPFRVNDICEEMAKRGHEVTVVTGEPNYPEGEIYRGYEKHKRADEVINGVAVHRCPIIPRKTDTFHRFLNYFSYPIASRRYIGKLPGDYDMVFIYQLSPVMMAEAGIKYGKRWKKPVVMYCLDLWPESLIAGGIGRDSLVYRIFHYISGRIYRSVDRILITSRMFQNYLVDEFGVGKHRIGYLPQYAEGIFEELPYKAHKEANLVFAGNIGTAQSVETIIRAAQMVRGVHFHIVGNGVELEKLKATAGNNVTFYGRRPIEEMPGFYAMADAMLVTLRSDPILSLTLPGKVQSYMAAGRPIIGAINGETAEVIKDARCGICGPAEDAGELAANIIRFVSSDEKETMAKNARKYYENHFMRSRFFDTLERVLTNESLSV